MWIHSRRYRFREYVKLLAYWCDMFMLSDISPMVEGMAEELRNGLMYKIPEVSAYSVDKLIDTELNVAWASFG